MKHVLFLLCFPLAVQSQSFKKSLPSYILTLLNGAADGAADGFRYHADGMGNFFNGKQSWLNKYRDRDPYKGPAYFGSTTFLAFTTDGVHLAEFASHQFNAMALALAPQREKKGFWKVAWNSVKYNLVYMIGRSAVLELGFPRRLP